ncbi:hypothetical protein Tco_0978291 [Tanacetum coccineum]|uniref:Uncharacterized protein n=1 Tax=Tanacetum coccineum TaxID=301880 RepID=A0ABQ5EMN9_9ASTR
MDDPNITMEEYIRLEEEKAQRHGRTFNRQTATYGKMEYCEDEDDCFTNFETEYPAIVFDDTLTSDTTLSCEPTVSPLNKNEVDFRISFDESDDEDYMVIFDENSFSYKIIYVDNLKTDSENENDKVNMPSFPSPEPSISHSDDLDFFEDYENEFSAITYMAPLPPRDQRHPWLRYQVEGYTEDIVHSYEQRLETIFGRSVNRVHALYFAGLTEGMRQTLAGRLRMVYTGDEGQELFTNPVRRLCHRMISCSISSRGQAPQKVIGVDLFYLRIMDRGTANVSYLLAHYLFRHAEGRKSGARLNIYERIGDTWAWVAPRPERQPNAAAGAPTAAEDGHAVHESASADPIPMQTP